MAAQVTLLGSEQPVRSKAIRVGPALATDVVHVDVYLRRPTLDARAAEQFAFPRGARLGVSQPDQPETSLAAGSRDIDTVVSFAAANNLKVDRVDAGSGVVRLSGPVAAINHAFGVDLSLFEASGVRFRSYIGPVHIAQELADIVAVVMGLDNHPIRHKRRRLLGSFAASEPQPGGIAKYTAPELARLYNFPDQPGDGCCLGIIELGSGFFQSDLDAYFAQLGIALPEIVVVGHNDPGTPEKPNHGYGEVVMDIEIAAAIVPKARTVVYFATGNTQMEFMDVMRQAIHDSINRPSVLSVSWGEPETAWSPAAADQMRRIIAEAARLGVTVCVASGDQGASDGVDGELVADFPGSVPEALCCGGTRLVANDGKVSSEITWNDPFWNLATGGGISVRFAEPPYQLKAGTQPQPLPPAGNSGRGIPDVAANADPMTGYLLYILGNWHVDGGTSASTPLWAALILQLNQALGRRVGYVNPFLYSLPYAPHAAFRDITLGNNNYYQATPGWDACTGLGSPDGMALLDAMSTALAECRGSDASPGVELS